MLCLRQRNETISSVLLVEREGIQIPVSYEVEGLVVKKFFGQGEQVEETPDANEGGIFDLRRKVSRPYGNRRRTKGRSKKNTGNHPKPHPKKSKQNTKLIPETTAISKFIPKLAELKHPKREA
ncbi:hypothetical protein Tco_0606334 [Tanacetum coccineum]